MEKLTTIAVLLVFGLLWPISVEAQQELILHQQDQSENRCAPYKDVTIQLKRNYKEGQAAIGLANNGQVFQIFSTKSGSSWTVLLTKPNGETCLIIAGEGLELIKDLSGIEISYPVKK